VEQSGTTAPTSTLAVERKALDPEWNAGTGELERQSGTVTVLTVENGKASKEKGPSVSSLNRSLVFRSELSDLLERFSRAKLGEGGSSQTIASYRAELRPFFSYLVNEAHPPLTAIADVTPSHLLAYRDLLMTRERKTRGASPAPAPRHRAERREAAEGSCLLAATTVASHVGAIRRFFEFLTTADILLLNPARHLKPPRVPRHLPRNVPSVMEMRRLLSAKGRKRPLAIRDQAILELLYGTGLRTSELCNLLLTDFDAERRILLIRHGKGGKDRILPVGEKAREALLAYLVLRRKAPLSAAPTAARPLRARAKAGGTYQQRKRYDMGPPLAAAWYSTAPQLFVNQFGRPMTGDALKDLVASAEKRAHLKKHISAHSLRHAFATHLLKGHADIRHIQRLLGHSSLRTTEIYTRVDTADLKKVLKRCHPREREAASGDDSQQEDFFPAKDAE
jgi:integrase/recombinase XerD